MNQQTNVDVVALFGQVAKKIEKRSDLPAITRETKFSSLGIDSVSMMEIIGEIEDELDITISDERLAQIQTVGDVENVVLARLNDRH
ncbi:MAG TPA: phosphopantetheine-binding protein [Bdellovibrionota bacterium]|jgi:acyl carrier protein|nr:phosphopantetheine-binding protein [Bdellovibrionota bacterium]